MSEESRADFERRLLALVRDFFDVCDKRHEHGWELGDFIVIYELFEDHGDDETMQPWWGGPAGSRFHKVAGSSSTRTWSKDSWLLGEMLRSTEIERKASDAAHDEDDDDDNEDEHEDSNADSG
jgi:hypothetical protein